MTWALNRFMGGVGGRWYTTYTAVPHYVTSAARSLFVATRTYLEFDFSKSGRVSVEAVAPHGHLHGELVTGHTPLEVRSLEGRCNLEKGLIRAQGLGLRGCLCQQPGAVSVCMLVIGVLVIVVCCCEWRACDTRGRKGGGGTAV